MAETPEELLDELYQLGNNGLDPDRPFDGQMHTDQGERGKTMVEGLRFRDVADCFVIGALEASGQGGLAESGTASYNDVYEGEEVDILASMGETRAELRAAITKRLTNDLTAREMTILMNDSHRYYATSIGIVRSTWPHGWSNIEYTPARPEPTGEK